MQKAIANTSVNIYVLKILVGAFQNNRPLLRILNFIDAPAIDVAKKNKKKINAFGESCWQHLITFRPDILRQSK